jgi:hypothetical protein
MAMSRQTEQIELRQEEWMTRLGDLWCTFMHDSPMWPIHGHYECADCGRRFLVPWEEHNSVPAHAGLIGFGHALASVHK